MTRLHSIVIWVSIMTLLATPMLQFAQQASQVDPFAAWAQASPTWSDAAERAIMPAPSRDYSMASDSVRSSMDFTGAVFNPFEVSTCMGLTVVAECGQIISA